VAPQNQSSNYFALKPMDCHFEYRRTEAQISYGVFDGGSRFGRDTFSCFLRPHLDIVAQIL
jgi:hypothetical protein